VRVEMRDKIASYLEKAGTALPAEQILRVILNILSPNSFAADRVLRGILGGDPRFGEREGLWSLTSPPNPGPVKVAALHLQWDRRRPGCFRGAVHLADNGYSREFLRTETASPAEFLSLRAARAAADGHLLLVWSAQERSMWNRLLRADGLPAWEGESLALSALAARALPHVPPLRCPEDAASTLGLPSPDTEKPAAMARFLVALWQSLLDMVPAGLRDDLTKLRPWIEEGSAKVDFTGFAFDRDFLARIPPAPGVYLMKNRSGEIIYVGKADNLRRRVRSYFTSRALKDAKTARIHGQLHSLELLTCATGVEALLLEMRMIRDFRPPVNFQTEIHEQPGRYGNTRNLLLLVPVGDNAEVYLVKDGAFVARHSIPLGRPPSKKLSSRIRAVYFGTRRRTAAKRENWETEIVARWLAAHKRRLNYVDADESGDCASVLRRLTCLLMDPDRLARKVYYR
jgi:hypothetical protein